MEGTLNSKFVVHMAWFTVANEKQKQRKEMGGGEEEKGVEEAEEKVKKNGRDDTNVKRRNQKHTPEV